MHPLVDGDILVYEVGFAAETAWKGENKGVDIDVNPPPFDRCADLLDNRIRNTCAIVGATVPPTLFLTGKENFRYDIAKRMPYKGGRGKKPYHYKNLIAYIKGKYDYRLTEGLEADDLMAIEQTTTDSLLYGNPLYRGPRCETIICTRDKDLRQVAGWHYGWELGNQPQFGPERVSHLGSIALSKNRKKIRGTGILFFYSQCLTGDGVDSIPGIDGCGPVKAYEILEHAKTEEEAFRSVLAAYRTSYPETAESELLEQGRLLHMTRGLHEDGSPILWEFPEYEISNQA
jgi:5'-3' exonuclease